MAIAAYGYCGEAITRNNRFLSQEISYRRVDPCHLEYLTAMGVKSSLVLPIVHDDQLWGLLAFHHSQSRSVSESEVELVQIVVEHLSVAISQSILMSQVPAKTSQEDTIKHISTLLHSLSSVEFQPALARTVTALAGSGGRLCMLNEILNLQVDSNNSFTDYLENSSEHLKVYTYGKQPAMPKLAKYQLLEQYSIWQEHYRNVDDDVWAISEIYQMHELRFLQVAFSSSKVRSLLMIRLQYRQQFLGYLSIFRDEVETEPLWAGEFDIDERQMFPRQSFNAWRESQKAQAREWTLEEIELANELGKQFAFAIHQYRLSQQLQRQTNNLQRLTEQRQALLKFRTRMGEK